MADNNQETSSNYGPQPDSATPMLAYVVDSPQSEGDTGLMLVGVLMRQRWLILATLFVCSAMSAIVAFAMTPVYRAEVLLAPVSETPRHGNLNGLPGPLKNIVLLPGVEDKSGNLKDEAIATLRSRAFTMRFIKEEKLMPILFDKYWDRGAEDWVVRPGKSPPSDWDAYKFFNEKVRLVLEDRRTGLVTLVVDWKDRELAPRWANQLVSRVNAHMRKRAIEDAEKSVAYLNQELKKTTVVELERSIYTLIEEQVQRIMMANVREQFAFKVIDSAAVPDADQFHRPQRASIVGLGMILGLLLGVALAIARQISLSDGGGRNPGNHS